jgi:hypothetical protein
MGLWRDKAQNILLGFLKYRWYRRIKVSKEKIRTKKEEDKKVSIKKAQYTSSSTRGLAS